MSTAFVRPGERMADASAMASAFEDGHRALYSFLMDRPIWGWSSRPAPPCRAITSRSRCTSAGGGGR